MNRVAHTPSDVDIDFDGSSNTWLALLLAAIIVAMLLVFVLFDQQTQWWFGSLANDLYVNTNYYHVQQENSFGLLAYFMAFGCVGAVIIGLSMLRSPVKTTTSAKSHLGQAAVTAFDQRMSAQASTQGASGNDELIPNSHTFDMINPKLRNMLNPTGQGQQSVFIYIDSDVDELNSNLWNDIHGYFAHYDKSLRLLAPPQMLSGHSPLSLESQVNRIHQHVMAHHLDKNSQILVIGEGNMVDTVSNVCQRYQSEVKLLRIPYH